MGTQSESRHPTACHGKVACGSWHRIENYNVRTTKKTKAITNGAISFPRISPNFIQVWFNGFNKFGCKKAKAKKIIDSIKGQICISEKFEICQIPTIKNKTENIIPKLFSDDFFIS